MKKLKIFVSAYACEPNLGSEIGVGWHWVLEMSKYFDLWVLTRKSNRQTIEAWIDKHSVYRNIHFLYYDWPKWARFWKKGLHGVRFYYNLWQLCSNGIVKRTMEENKIEIYHLLTYGNALWPASRYGQQKFFIWGPIGGVDTITKDYTRHYNMYWRVVESIRLIIVKTLIYNIGYKTRCKNANLILCKSKSMLDAIPPKCGNKAILFTDVAVESIRKEDYSKSRQKEDTTIYFLMVGRLDAWRGFDLAIEAFALAIKKVGNIHLDIVGDGSDKKRIIKWISKYKLNNYVTLHGAVSMKLYYQMMANCDVVLNLCLKEGSVTTAFDSLSLGKPLICIDTGGYTRYFSEDYALVVPKGNRKDTIYKLSKSIVRITDFTVRDTLGQKAFQIGEEFSWERKGIEISKIIYQSYNAIN